MRGWGGQWPAKRWVGHWIERWGSRESCGPLTPATPKPKRSVRHYARKSEVTQSTSLRLWCAGQETVR